MKMKIKTKVIKSLLTTSMALGIACQVQAVEQPTTFVHLFEWSWQDVAQVKTI